MSCLLCNITQLSARMRRFCRIIHMRHMTKPMDKSVLIVGHGVVGHNLEQEIIKLKPDVYDIKYLEPNVFGIKGIDSRKPHYDFAFICIDTKKMDTIEAPIDDLVDAINDNNADIFVVKSTMLPGSTERLKEITGKRIVFSPEYYGGTQHCNNFDFDFTILGGDKEDCLKVQQLLQEVYDGRHTFRIVDSKTAELAKYMENSWLATKVSFCQQFFDIAEDIGVSYEELRELFVLDPRVNPSHTFVYKDHPYWSSHCLNKDVPTIAHWADAKLLKAVIEFNEGQKKRGE